MTVEYETSGRLRDFARALFIFVKSAASNSMLLREFNRQRAAINQAFENWMTASSAGVEREIAEEKSKSDTQPTVSSPFDEQLKADIGRDIDRIFAEAVPSVFKSAA